MSAARPGEFFALIPHRIWREFRRGNITGHQFHLLVDLLCLASIEDYNLGQPLSYRLSELADALEWRWGEDKLRKDLNSLCREGFLALTPGNQKRRWLIAIGPEAKVRPSEPPLAGQGADEAQTEPGQTDNGDAPKPASCNDGESPAGPPEGGQDEAEARQATTEQSRTEQELEIHKRQSSSARHFSNRTLRLPELPGIGAEEGHPRGERGRAIKALLKHLSDADEGTQGVLEAFELPAEAFYVAGEKLLEKRRDFGDPLRSPVRYVVGTLREMQRERRRAA